MSDESEDPQANDRVVVSNPNAARIYDYLLGGKDSFEAARDAAERLLKLILGAAAAAIANRLFLERVAYVDNDPVVVSHGLAMLGVNERVAMVHSDLRTPREIMTHTEVNKRIDFSGPVAALMLASLHFITDAENPQATLDLWRATMCYGSYLAISHITADEVGPATAKAAPAVPRTRAHIESFFDGFELVPPGVVDINLWPVPVLLYGGVGQRR